MESLDPLKKEMVHGGSKQMMNKLIASETIINYIKLQRLGWLGHVHRMPDERRVKKVYEWKLIRKAPKQVGELCEK